jgi:hypothetical protein
MTIAITPKELQAVEERWRTLRDAGDPAAVEAEQEFQRMARAQTEGLQRQAETQMISRMLK